MAMSLILFREGFRFIDTYSNQISVLQILEIGLLTLICSLLQKSRLNFAVMIKVDDAVRNSYLLSKSRHINNCASYCLLYEIKAGTVQHCNIAKICSDSCCHF